MEKGVSRTYITWYKQSMTKYRPRYMEELETDFLRVNQIGKCRAHVCMDSYMNYSCLYISMRNGRKSWPTPSKNCYLHHRKDGPVNKKSIDKLLQRAGLYKYITAEPVSICQSVSDLKDHCLHYAMIMKAFLIPLMPGYSSKQTHGYNGKDHFLTMM